MSITSVVFSKDRSAQLDLLLNSIQRNARHLFSDIRVLYIASNDEFQSGYDILIKEWEDLVEFTRETNFCEDTRRLSTTDEKLMCYFTDDDVFYRKVDFKLKELINLFESMEIGCFSFRLGRNTVIQNPITKEQTNCPNYIANYNGKFQIWDKNSVSGNSNYNYNLSVDGHIFRSKTINGVLGGFEFEHPNDFEGRLQNLKQLFSPLMASPEQSYLVGIPINTVNSKCKNQFGTYFPQSQLDFNTKYLQGKRIKLEKIDFLNVLGTHQEFVLPME